MFKFTADMPLYCVGKLSSGFLFARLLSRLMYKGIILYLTLRLYIFN